jgi:hypothetical protein
MSVCGEMQGGNKSYRIFWPGWDAGCGAFTPRCRGRSAQIMPFCATNVTSGEDRMVLYGCDRAYFYSNIFCV